MSNLQGKVALVTGASRGVGAAVAEMLAERGADVVIHFHSKSRRGAPDRAITSACSQEFLCSDHRCNGLKSFAGGLRPECPPPWTPMLIAHNVLWICTRPISNTRHWLCRTAGGFNSRLSSASKAAWRSATAAWYPGGSIQTSGCVFARSSLASMSK